MKTKLLFAMTSLLLISFSSLKAIADPTTTPANDTPKAGEGKVPCPGGNTTTTDANKGGDETAAQKAADAAKKAQ